MTKVYTYEEMLARQEALRNVRTMDDVKALVAADPTKKQDAWMSMQPKFVKPDYSRRDPAGKVMTSRYNGRCADCNGWINAGEQIRYDGKAHHYPECPQTTKPNPMQGYNDETQTWDEDPMGAWDSNADDFRSAPKPAPTAKAAEEPAGTTLPDGTITLEFEDGHYRTFRIRTQKADADFAPGERIVAYLAKADNDDESSYVKFAFLKGNKLVIWKRYRDSSDLVNDAQALTDADKAMEMGLKYALSSGNCWRCHKTLTVPASLHRGLGRKCAEKVFG